MTTNPLQPAPTEKAVSTLLDVVLGLVAGLIETPTQTARRVATVVTVAAAAITGGAALLGLGSAAGLGLGMVYAGSCWALWLYLSTKRGSTDNDR